MSDVVEDEVQNGLRAVGDLAGAAADALDGEQGQLEGTNHAMVKFVSMAWQTLELPELKEIVTFEVEGMVVGHGEEVMADGSIRQVAKVKVQSVVKVGDGE